MSDKIDQAIEVLREKHPDAAEYLDKNRPGVTAEQLREMTPQEVARLDPEVVAEALKGDSK